jgi:hypothetical protein
MYLSWFKTKERLRRSKEFIKDFATLSLEDIAASERFANINKTYQELIKNATQK